MFDLLVKRTSWVWIYKTRRFAEERRTFLCDLSERGHGLRTLQDVNKLLLVIAEQVNVRQPMPITEAPSADLRNLLLVFFCCCETFRPGHPYIQLQIRRLLFNFCPVRSG